MLKDFLTLFLKHTSPSRHHLTPELILRLITPACPLWSARVEESPFIDPYWGFYWPGGQATARPAMCKYASTGVVLHSHHRREIIALVVDEFTEDPKTPRLILYHNSLTPPVFGLGISDAILYILDNPTIVKDRRVLDVGCGCGAGAIAAAMMKAKTVVANDIDPYAVLASKINAELNSQTIETDKNNFIGSSCSNFDAILIGDMFYDEQFGSILFSWLTQLVKDGKMILIGDPGRHGLTESRRSQMSLLAKYDLPKETRDENNGYTETSLWTLNKI